MEVIIGKKPIGAYLTVIVAKQEKVIKLVSRGKVNVKSLDLAEILKRNFGYKVKTMETDTEVVKGNDGKDRNLTKLVIELTKG